MLDFAADFAEAMKQMAVWVSQGQIKSKNTVVKGGLQKAEQALADMFKGINTGNDPFNSQIRNWQTERLIRPEIRKIGRRGQGPRSELLGVVSFYE